MRYLSLEMKIKNTFEIKDDKLINLKIQYPILRLWLGQEDMGT